MNQTQATTVNYSRQWIFFFLLLAALAGILHLRSNVFSPGSPTPVAHQKNFIHENQDKNWFFILKMPEVTTGFPPEAAQAKFESWLNTLLKQGYHPLLLSEIFRRIGRGESLPAQAVALSFDPGYRQTFEILSPVLAKHAVPAVWMTDEEALKKFDLRFLSFHQLGVMKKSGSWDIALKDPSGKFSFSEEKTRWAFESDTSALNNRHGNPVLNRLSVNPTWSDEEFTDRLKAEQPIEGPVYLAARQIQDRTWGVTIPLAVAVPKEANEEPASKENPLNEAISFDLAASPTKRSGHLSWLGSAGCQNLQLNLSVDRIDGELWLLLRSDPTIDERVNVGFTRDAWIVEEHVNGTDKVLAFSPWTQPHKTAVEARVDLIGNKITVSVDGEPPFALDTLKENSSAKGIIELDVYDKVRDVAQAKAIRISVRPLK